MKKYFVLIFIMILTLTGCQQSNIHSGSTSMIDPVRAETTVAAQTKEDKEYVKAIWFTYYELSPMLKGTREPDFQKNIKTAFNRVKEMGFNTVIVQVRAFADALYDSAYFPLSKSVLVKGNEMLFDPLSVMCEQAHRTGLKIEAWVNPYRISNQNDIKNLSKSHVAVKWYQKKKTKSNIYIAKDGIYFNPAAEKVAQLIVNGVKEIAGGYDVDGIHFDDYFYPTTKEKIDKKEYAAYCSKHGKTSLSDFRRGVVSNMIQSVYRAIKDENANITFGISPASNIKDDYETLYADVASWASEEGYCDYVCPQVYFGFRNVYQPFMFTVKKWIGVTQNHSLYIGLPLYKANKFDKYAAQNDKSIQNEFKNCHNIIARQITYLSKLDEIGGFFVFSYSSLDDEACTEEVENMIKAMR